MQHEPLLSVVLVPAGTAARIKQLEADAEMMFAKGMSHGQQVLKDTGRLVIVDSPEVVELREALTRANAATAAAYEVAAEETPYESDRDAIRALATPDQTAALDRMIAEAVNTSMQGVERWEIPVQSIEHCIDRMVVTSSQDADTKKSLRLWLLSLAASKKVSKP